MKQHSDILHNFIFTIPQSLSASSLIHIHYGKTDQINVRGDINTKYVLIKLTQHTQLCTWCHLCSFYRPSKNTWRHIYNDSHL